MSILVGTPAGAPKSTPQSFSTSFDLSGTPDQGELSFLTPLGSTAAVIQWSPVQATLTAQGKVRTFAGLTPLIHELLGTDIPIHALFAWLQGSNQSANDWSADLTQFAQGKITAQRNSAPPAQLRLILEP